jgi:hypothetical protein
MSRGSEAESGGSRPAGTLSDRAARRLLTKQHKHTAPKNGIAIKREAHVFDVDADASAFAHAFQDVLRDPGATFGVVRIKRIAECVGRDFVEGERFQGGFSIRAAVESSAMPARLKAAMTRLLDHPLAASAIERLEEAFLSDYGELEQVLLEPDASRGEVHTVSYRYLEGTPLAGSTTYTVEPLPSGGCRVTQIFRYQEVNSIALNTFQRFGIKYHDAAVYWQIRCAADRIDARVTKSSVIPEYT